MNKTTKLPKLSTVKLALTKETIRLLPKTELGQAVGGAITGVRCALSRPCHTC